MQAMNGVTGGLWGRPKVNSGCTTTIRLRIVLIWRLKNLNIYLITTVNMYIQNKSKSCRNSFLLTTKLKFRNCLEGTYNFTLLKGFTVTFRIKIWNSKALVYSEPANYSFKWLKRYLFRLWSIFSSSLT